MVSSVGWQEIRQSITNFANTCYLWLAERIRKLVSYFFFTDFHGFKPAALLTRRQGIIDTQGAKTLRVDGTQIDALYIPSSSPFRTGNAVVLCLNGPYQKANPEKHWLPLLKNGADVVLWNPEQLAGTVKIAENLLHVLQTLRQGNPSQAIAVKGMCAAVDPCIKAVSELNDDKVHLIIDRGFGNTKKLVHALSIFGRLSIFQTIVGQYFDCQGIEKIEKVKGKMLFLIPKMDQVLDVGTKNLTRELFEKAPFDRKELIELKEMDHFSPLNHDAYNRMLRFLAKVGIVRQNFEGVDQKLFPISDIGCVRRTIFPKVIHSCF